MMNILTKSLKILTATVFVSVAFSSLQVQTASACKCADPQAPAAELQQADAVFSGKVTEIAPDSSNTETSVRIAEFAVERAWKGVFDTTTTVLTEADTPACGFPFRVDQEYLVYANRVIDFVGAEFSTGLCTRTRLLADAGEDLAVLGSLTHPSFHGTPPPVPPGLRIGGLIIIAVSLLLGAYKIKNRRRQGKSSWWIAFLVLLAVSMVLASWGWGLLY